MPEIMGTISIKGNQIIGRANGQIPTIVQGPDLCADTKVTCEFKPYDIYNNGTFILESATPLPHFCSGLSGIAARYGQTLNSTVCEADFGQMNNASDSFQPGLYYQVTNGNVQIAGAQIPMNEFAAQLDTAAIQHAQSEPPPENSSIDPALTCALIAVAGVGVATAFVVGRIRAARRAEEVASRVPEPAATAKGVVKVGASLVSQNRTLLAIEAGKPTERELQIKQIMKETSRRDELAAYLERRARYRGNSNWLDGTNKADRQAYLEFLEWDKKRGQMLYDLKKDD